jgi:membrane associated rhomboid family serine protease
VLPIRDRNPSGIVPWVTYALIVANSAVFILELGLPEEELMQLAQSFGFVPARVTQGLQGELGFLEAALVPAVTSMFLHGGWLHLLGNMWFLHIFGDNIEARLGRIRYLVFYVFCGLMAVTAQYVLDPASSVPIIGASGAIAGVLGAYLICWPRARVLTIVPIFYFIHFVHLPAVFVLVAWFLIQLLQGAASLGVEFAHGVAYWAHVGGFVTGAVLIYILPSPKGSPRRDRRRR